MIPFADSKKNLYEVRIYREDYYDEPEELTGATSCFVVSGTDEDFMYHPVRTSTATISVLESDLLLDLYSINNQYAAVKLLKNEVLEWTGYIKPEQFTQPFVPTAQSVSVECVCAIATLEHIEYETQTESGYITLWNLMKYLISSAKGGYRGVYIPHVYGASNEMSGNVLNDILLCEENFTSQEMMLDEVLEHVCKFLNWTVYDLKGYLYFVDVDWRGAYRLYDEALSGYTTVYGNEVQTQVVGFNGSDSNTLDIVPGFNKATVKSVNNVFDEVIEEEPYDVLETVQTWKFNEGDFEEARRVVREFKEPMLWKMYYYDHTAKEITQEDAFKLQLNTEVAGCIELKENSYKVTESNGKWVPNVTEYEWNDLLMMRPDNSQMMHLSGNKYKAFEVRGVNSVWKDGAFGLNMSVGYRTGSDLVYPVMANYVMNTLFFRLRIGEYYWNGNAWVTDECDFSVKYEVENGGEFNPIVSNKNADMPYKGLNGHIVELPDDKILKGELVLTMYMNVGAGNDGCFIKDFRLDYAKKDGTNDEGEDGDRIYENVVNERYMSEADEIEFGIGSYNKDGATYSKALLGDKFLENDLYCAVVGEKVRPEELMIRRIVNRYGETKIKLTEALCMTDDITPLSALSDKAMVGKRFRMTSGTWDYEQNRLTVQMQEEAE